MKEPRVIAIVVTYNRKKLLAECLQALLDQSYKNLDIIVIDNASTDKTREYISGFIGDKVSYYNTGKNLGGAGGFNFGIKKAYEFDFDYLWIMDDDTVPNYDALFQLLEAHKKYKHAGFLSSKVLWTDGNLCFMNLGRDYKFRTISNYRDDIVPCAAATFVSLLIPKKIVEEVGLPISEFFIWGDDLEYTRRITRKYSGYIITNSVVMHKMKNNDFGSIEVTPKERIDRYIFAYRNEVFLYRKEGVLGWMRILLRIPVHISRVLIKSKSDRMRRISIILKGTIKGFSFKPAIEYITFENNK